MSINHSIGFNKPCTSYENPKIESDSCKECKRVDKELYEICIKATKR